MGRQLWVQLHIATVIFSSSVPTPERTESAPPLRFKKHMRLYMIPRMQELNFITPSHCLSHRFNRKNFPTDTTALSCLFPTRAEPPITSNCDSVSSTNSFTRMPVLITIPISPDLSRRHSSSMPSGSVYLASDMFI